MPNLTPPVTSAQAVREMHALVNMCTCVAYCVCVFFVCAFKPSSKEKVNFLPTYTAHSASKGGVVAHTFMHPHACMFGKLYGIDRENLGVSINVEVRAI
jgi:hypothetical protein